MGKKRIAIIGEEPKKSRREVSAKGRKVVKTGKDGGRITDMGAEALAEAERIKEKEEKQEKEALVKITKKAAKIKPTKKRGAKYFQARQKIDRTKSYPLPQAIKLLKNISISKFNGSVDIHLNLKEVGLKGEIKFPHPTGKDQIVRIADDQLIAELEGGKINFTSLIASPKMMPKLVKFAKLLGPRGLMPNPKTGTISDKPEQLVKKLAGKTQFRTEAKVPLIHITIGKVNSPEKHLEENFQTLIEAVGKKNIKKAVLVPTMGPGIKVNLEPV